MDRIRESSAAGTYRAAARDGTHALTRNISSARLDEVTMQCIQVNPWGVGQVRHKSDRLTGP